MSKIETTYVQHCGSDKMVANAARVSFRKWTETLRVKDVGLIKFLAKHNHRSPFNHTFITCHVRAPIFVARQLVKHEYMPWNEVSGRYVTFEPDFFEPDEYRAKAEDKKQGSGEPIKGDAHDGLRAVFNTNHQTSFARYMEALQRGLCEEQARTLLPLDLMTEWYWSGTLGAWAKMHNLRFASDAQKESQEVARQAGEIIEPLFPHSWKALTT